MAGSKGKKSKKNKKIIKLVSTGLDQNNQPTKHFYTTRKSPKLTVKLSLKKFDPRAYNPATNKRGMHVAYKEEKIR